MGAANAKGSKKVIAAVGPRSHWATPLSKLSSASSGNQVAAVRYGR
jgi:hypothetical protein